VNFNFFVKWRHEPSLQRVNGTYVNVSQLPRPLVLLLSSGKDDRTNGVSIYFFLFIYLDVSLKKQFIIHDIKYLAGTL